MSEQEQRPPELRLGCRLFGCGPYGYLCERCGTGIYDGDYIDRGLLSPVIQLYWSVHYWVRRPKYCCKPIGDDSQCTLRKGHEGACDDIPF